MLSSMDDMAAVLVGVVIAVEHSLDRVFLMPCDPAVWPSACRPPIICDAVFVMGEEHTLHHLIEMV